MEMLWKAFAGRSSRVRTFTVDFPACFLGALLLLTLPLNWLLAAVIAAGFHELCHVLAIRLLGGEIRDFQVGMGGAVIETVPLSGKRELICALAGPMGSLLLFSLCRWIPRIALCALVQALFNLMPVYPLDGGRVLHCGAGLVLPEKKAAKLCKCVEVTSVGGIALFSVIATFLLHLGILPVLIAGILVIKAYFRKIPCKAAQLGVQ